ncbi:MAG: transcriptional regulator [Thermoplasmata archaeon]
MSPAESTGTGSAMAIEDELSGNAVKVYKAMKDLAWISEEKMGTAERVTQTVKLPKTMVMNALQELQAKGFARRKVREKAAGYYLTK